MTTSKAKLIIKDHPMQVQKDKSKEPKTALTENRFLLTISSSTNNIEALFWL